MSAKRADTNNQKLVLHEFLEDIERIPSEFIPALLKATTDEDHKNIINAFAPTLKNQFKELGSYVTEVSNTATKQSVAEVETFLRVSSGASLVKDLKTALPSIGSAVGKLGVAGIIGLIKKIIKFILEILPIRLPKWINKLIDLIDEIIGVIFGGDSIKMRTALSQAEQNYLAEMTQLAKLEKITNNGLDDDEDEEE